MSLEQDINQSVFKSEHQKAAINLIYTSHWLNEKTKTVLDKEDITPQQFNILRILRGAREALSTMQIRERMLDKMSDTSRIVDRLISKNFVTKKVRSSDKRLVDVTISEKGKDLLQKLDGFDDEMRRYLDALSTEQAVQLNELLDKIRE